MTQTEPRAVLLVPIDFEPGSEAALAFAKHLASRLDDEVVLVHVYQLPVYTYPGIEPLVMPGFFPEVVAAAKRAFDVVCAEAGGLRGVLREGEPSREILAAAAETGASMIVMATHGRHGIAHLLLGSVTEKVIREARVPVVTVRSP